MLLKIGVNFEPDKTLRTALWETQKVFREHNKLMIITSLKDREHHPRSLHYYGQAFDIRIKHLEPIELDAIRDKLIFVLEPEYKVLLEKDHIHIEVNHD